MRENKSEFFKQISKLDRKEYMSSFLTYMITPLIMSLKPSMTVSIKLEDRDVVKSWLQDLSLYGIKKIVLKQTEDKEILFLYRRELLDDILTLDENIRILSPLGYRRRAQLSEKLERLKLRFSMESFPHELGIFLGIPAKDVLGFMSGRKSLYTGYWKVYEDRESSEKLFKLYDLSKDMMAQSIIEGKNVREAIYTIREAIMPNRHVVQ